MLLLRQYVNEWHGWDDVEHGYFDRARQPDIAESSYIMHALLPEASVILSVILCNEHDRGDSSCVVCVIC